MAKVPFTKLGLKIDSTVSTIVWNEQIIEVQNYLPFTKKLEVITNIVNNSVDDNNFYNPMRVNLYMTLEVIEAYTNLSFTSKQKEDLFKLYDLIISSGLWEQIYLTIPESELAIIENNTTLVIDNIYKYHTSFLGMLETVKSDYGTLNLDSANLESALTNSENIEFLKDVLNKLG